MQALTRRDQISRKSDVKASSGRGRGKGKAKGKGRGSRGGGRGRGRAGRNVEKEEEEENEDDVGSDENDDDNVEKDDEDENDDVEDEEGDEEQSGFYHEGEEEEKEIDEEDESSVEEEPPRKIHKPTPTTKPSLATKAKAKAKADPKSACKKAEPKKEVKPKVKEAKEPEAKVTSKAKGKRSKGDENATRKKRRAATPDPELPTVNLNERRIQSILSFLDRIDCTEGMEEIKQQIREELDQVTSKCTQLNIYWTRYSCGVRLKPIDGLWKNGQDVAFFSFCRAPPKHVPSSTKLIVAIATAQLFVSCLPNGVKISWLFTFALVSKTFTCLRHSPLKASYLERKNVSIDDEESIAKKLHFYKDRAWACCFAED